MAIDFLNDDVPIKNQEAKWNMFHFQDHLLSWISASADYFHRRDYPNSFEALTNVYTDVWGFFNDTEKKEIDILFNKTKFVTDKYISYNIDFSIIQQKVKGQLYAPPTNVYITLLEFRKKLLELMTKYNLTITRIKRDSSGAGSA